MEPIALFPSPLSLGPFYFSAFILYIVPTSFPSLLFVFSSLPAFTALKCTSTCILHLASSLSPKQRRITLPRRHQSRPSLALSFPSDPQLMNTQNGTSRRLECPSPRDTAPPAPRSR